MQLLKSAYFVQITIKVGMPYLSWLNITCASSFSHLYDCAFYETSHTPIPTCMRFGSTLSCLRPSYFLFFLHPPHKTAIDADWRSCWGVTTKRWRVCRQLKIRYWPSSVSQRVPLTGPGDERKWASALYVLPSRLELVFLSNRGLSDHAACTFVFQ